MKFFNILTTLVVTGIMLAGCGGGGGTSPPEQQAQESILRAVAGINTSGPAIKKNQEGRRKALAATPAHPVITADQLLAWAERSFPEFFPAGPSSVVLTYEGENYQAVRAYSTGNYLAVTVSGEVRGIGPYTGYTLVTHGTLAGFTCQVLPSVCMTNDGTGPGSVSFSRDTGIVFLPNLGKDGTLQWLGVVEGTPPVVTPTDIKSVQWYSNRTGGWDNNNATANQPPADGSYLAPKATCNRDRGLPTMTTKADVVLWPGFSADGWKLVGDANPHQVFGHIEYGGYEPATISVVREANNTVTLVMDFTSDCLFGFGKDGKLAVLDRTQPFEFAWHSNKAGAGRGPGWGSGPTTLMPTVHKAYASYDEGRGRFIVRFPNMACTDAGSATVSRHKTISGDVIDYDYGTDGYGAGWLATPGPTDGNPIWQAGPGVTFDPMTYQVKWSQALCTEL